MKTTQIDFRAAIQSRMAQRGWSQYELAKQSGINQQTVNRYLSGQRDMTGERLAALLDALGITLRR